MAVDPAPVESPPHTVSTLVHVLCAFVPCLVPPPAHQQQRVHTRTSSVLRVCLEVRFVVLSYREAVYCSLICTGPDGSPGLRLFACFSVGPPPAIGFGRVGSAWEGRAFVWNPV